MNGHCGDFFIIYKDLGVDAEWMKINLISMLDDLALKHDPVLQTFRERCGPSSVWNGCWYALQFCFGAVNRQRIHLDTRRPNYQASIVLSGSKPTEFFVLPNGETNVEWHTFDAAVGFLLFSLHLDSREHQKAKTDVVNALQQAERKCDSEACDKLSLLLQLYGQVLDHRLQALPVTNVVGAASNVVEIGYIGYPGLLRHSAPSSARNRVVYSAGYGSDDVERDDSCPFSAPTLFLELMRTTYDSMVHHTQHICWLIFYQILARHEKTDNPMAQFKHLNKHHRVPKKLQDLVARCWKVWKRKLAKPG